MLAAAPLGAPLLCILWVVFFNHSIKPFQATRSENDEEFKTGGEGDGGRRLGQRAAPRGPPGKEAPSAPSRPAAPRRAAAAARASAPVTSRGLSGTYVTPRGRCRCSCPPPASPLPKASWFPRPRNSLSAPGGTSPPAPAAPRLPRSFPPRRLPPGGKRRCAPRPAGSAPAPRRDGPARSAASGARRRLLPGELLPRQAAPGSQHGRGKAAGAPAAKRLREEKFPSPSADRPRRPNPLPPGYSGRARAAHPAPSSSGSRPSARPPPAPPPSPRTAAVIHPAAAGGRAPGHRPRGAGPPPSWEEPGGGKGWGGGTGGPAGLSAGSRPAWGEPERARRLSAHEWHLVEDGFAERESVTSVFVGWFFWKTPRFRSLCTIPGPCFMSVLSQK